MFTVKALVVLRAKIGKVSCFAQHGADSSSKNQEDKDATSARLLTYLNGKIL